MIPAGWKRTKDPELGEFYDTTVAIDGHELLALVVQFDAESSIWEGTVIDAAGVEVKTVRWANCSREDAMQLIAVEATYLMQRVVRALGELWGAARLISRQPADPACKVSAAQESDAKDDCGDSTKG